MIDQYRMGKGSTLKKFEANIAEDGTLWLSLSQRKYGYDFNFPVTDEFFEWLEECRAEAMFGIKT
jgi:hypothetical protein